MAYERRGLLAEILEDTGDTGVALADGAITADKIASNAIAAAKIAASAITDAKIATGAITADKLAANAITDAKIATGAITAAKIAASAITAAKFDGLTAFPLTAADAGATALARTGADGDTLKTISDHMDTVQGLVQGIGSGGGAALNFAADSDNASGAIVGGVTKVGTQTNTYANTAAENLSYHILTHDTNNIDWVYGFSVGAGRTCAKVVFKGYLTASNPATGKSVTISAWNGSTWDTRGTIVGQSGTVNVTRDIDLLAVHTGSGANAGKVYLRFTATAQAGAVLNVDSLLAQAQNIGQTVGYSDGAIWIDTTISNEGTTPFVDGTADNPVSTIAAANTLAASVDLHRFRVAPGSSITFAAPQTNDAFVGRNWTLALGGQDISGSYVEGATVTGIGIGTSEATFVDCAVGPSTTLDPAVFMRCGFNTPTGTPFTAGDDGQYVFVDCYSLVPGSGTPFFTFAGLGATTGINFRRWSGGSNVTLDADCTMTMEVVTGGGQTVTTGGGNAEIRGICRAVTVVTTLTSTTQIACVTGPIAISGDGGTVNIFGVAGIVADTSTGTTVTNRALSQQTVASQLGGQQISKTITYNGGVLYTAFTVTGLVAVRILGYVTTALTNNAATTSVGTDSSAAGLIAATAGTAMQTVGQVWVDTAPSKLEALLPPWALIGGGEDIAITGHADLAAGVVDLYCWYVPISAGASVVAA